jgi:hypothetical protein
MLRYDDREKEMEIYTELMIVGIALFGLSCVNEANRLLDP